MAQKSEPQKSEPQKSEPANMVLQKVPPCATNVQKPRESSPEEWIALDNGGFARVHRSSMMSFMKKLVLKSRNWLNVRWAEPLCNYQEAPTYADDDASVPIDKVQDLSKSAANRSSSNVKDGSYVDPPIGGTKLQSVDHATGITEEYIATMFYQKSGLKMNFHMDHKRKEAFLCDSNVDAEVDKCCVCNNVEAPKRQKGESGETIVTTWIGCNNCPNWFHSTCLTEKVDEDTFVCKFCTPDTRFDAGSLPEKPTSSREDKVNNDPPAPTMKNEFFNCKDCVVDSTEFVYCWCKSKYRHVQCHTTSKQGFLCSATCRYSPGGKDVSNYRCSVCRSTDTTDLLRCFKCNHTICHKDCIAEDNFIIGYTNLFVCDECCVI